MESPIEDVTDAKAEIDEIKEKGQWANMKCSYLEQQTSTIE